MEYLLIPSMRSKRLFEVLKSWSKLPEVEIPLEILHKQLEVSESQKKDFKELRTRVLDKAQKEIIKNTNFFFEYEPVKKGVGKTSPVVAIKFIFSPKKALPVAKDKLQKGKEREEQKAKLFKRAFYCAEQKKGACIEQNQPAYVCKLCQKERFCEQMTRSRTQNSLLNSV